MNSPILSRNFILVTIAMLFAGSCGEILGPTLPQFTLSLGVDVSLSGLSITIYGLTAMAFRPVAGMLLDRIGRRKVVMAGVVVYTGVLLLYLYVTAFWQLIAVRILQGMAMCTTSTGLSTMITDVVPKDRLTEGMALSNVAGAICMSVGPALALFVAQQYSMRGVFVLCIIITAASFFLLLPMKYDETALLKEAKATTPAERKGIFSAFERTAILPTIMLMVLVLGQSSVYTFLPQYGAQQGIGDVGGFFLATAVGVIYVRLSIRKILSIFTERAIMLFGTLTFFTCIAIFSLPLTTVTLLTSGLIFGFGYGAILAVLNGMALSSCPPERRGAANATYYIAFDLGFALGSFMWGFVIKLVGYQSTFLLAAILTLFALPIYFFIYLPKRKQAEMMV